MKIGFVALVLLVWSVCFGQEVKVQSGDFAYFGVLFSPSSVAGENGKITVSAYDAYGNPTNYFGPSKRVFTVAKTGSAVLGKETLSSDDFQSGSVSIAVSDQVAESAKVSFTEGQSPLIVKNMSTGTFIAGLTLQFAHGPVAAFKVSVPEKLLAGEDFTLTITAMDQFGNVIHDYSNNAGGTVVTAEGENGKKTFIVPSDRFNEGRAEVMFRYDYSGNVTLDVADINNQSAKGKTGPVVFEQQRLARLDVTPPESIRTGVPFVVEIKAINQFGQIMKNYSVVGDNVLLSANGSGKLLPNTIPASSFIQGVVHFETLYTVPEAITITAAPEKTPLVQSRTVPETAKAAMAPSPLTNPPSTQPNVQPNETKAVSMPSSLQPKTRLKKMPLTFNFGSTIGDIQRIETEYIPEGEKGINRIYVCFTNKNPKTKNIQPIHKEITMNGRIIGILDIDGEFDSQDRLKIDIEELEPFTLDTQYGRNEFKLTFLIK